MIIIGVDYHPEFQQLASVDSDTGEVSEARLQNPEQAQQFDRELAGRGARCESEWKLADMLAGWNDCLQNCSLSCGSEMQPRSRRSECANKKRIDTMPGSFCSCCWRIGSLEFGCQVRRTVT